MGPREIQLLLGDITQLPVENKVDFIFTSAFMGDYLPVPGTLIGSLKSNLGVIVADLARNKALDLRKNFSCWVSQPLDQHLPYRRLVCFEMARSSSTLVEQISLMFRAMMPIFNNTETTVITPLLATGNQCQSMSKMMLAIVNAASDWVKAGLPLRCLKIVLFSRRPEVLSKSDEENMQLFSELKAKWAEIENTEKNEEVEPYDVCLSFAPKNQILAERVRDCLLEQVKDLKIHSQGFEFNHEDVWQEETFSVMKSSKKIIVVVTAAYVADLDCLEQFSMALCCNRLQNAEVVSPFYMETVESIPSYMSLVQYTECRVRKDDETFKGLLLVACVALVRTLPKEGYGIKETSLLERNRGSVYDIFLSYSHRRPAEPVELHKILTEKHPDLNVFFDKSELKAGNLWQQTLYEAVDSARCVVAFLSPGYLHSSVCSEEFNIALAKHYACNSILFIPVHTDALETIPKSFSSVPCLNLAKGELTMQQLADKLAHLVVKYKDNLKIPDPGILKQKLEKKRTADFAKKFRVDDGQVAMKATKTADLEKGEVVFSFAQDCLHLAAIMCTILKQQAPNLVGHLFASSQSQRRAHLDSANMVVIFISDQYVSTQSLIEELHIALCRQRMEKAKTIVYLVQCDHSSPKPFYLQALPFSVSLEDEFWHQHEQGSKDQNPRYMVDMDGMEGMYRCSAAQNLALTAAVYDVIQIMSEKVSTVPYNIINIARVENQMKGVADDHVNICEYTVNLEVINPLVPTPMASLNASTELGEKQMLRRPKPSGADPSVKNTCPDAYIQPERQSQKAGDQMGIMSSTDKAKNTQLTEKISEDLNSGRPVTNANPSQSKGSQANATKVLKSKSKTSGSSKACIIA